MKDPTRPLWRSAVLLRAITWLFAVGVVAAHHGEYASSAAAWATVGAIGAWTAVSSVYYLRVPRPATWVTVLDLAVSCAAMSVSRIALTHDQLTEQGVPLLTTVWVTGVVAVGAVHGGRVGGTVFGLVVALFNFGVRGYVDTDLTRDLVLLVGIGFLLGLATSTSRASAERLARALRVEAATAERERLARSIHDSVLQVLARVRKRGAELGGEAAELADLAGAQEAALRALVAAGPLESTGDGTDLRPHLQVLATDRVHVSVPGTPVLLPDTTATELTDLTREALENAHRHAGPDAQVWVLLEDLGRDVVLSIRDDGAGIPPGRLAEAEAQGRMGVAKSIRGRVTALGGTASVTTAPGEGTEWELTVGKNHPRTREAR